MVDASLLETIRALPKIELHRHLEGSVRIQTLIDIAEEYGIEMPEYDVETLRPFVQMMPYEPRNTEHFMGKFHTLRQFYRSLDVIQRITREAIIDAAEDNIKYLELRFTPAALSNIIRVSYPAVVDAVCKARQEAMAEYDVEVGLIVSMNRHETIEQGQMALQAALEFRKSGVIGLDLAGFEKGHSANPFRAIFRQAKAEGLGVTVHAGEWEGADSVWEAVGNLGAIRVGHGIRSLEDPGIINVLVERGITLEVCPSSNVDSGVVDSLGAHPLRELHYQNVVTTINTDDPLISNITLSEEIARAVEHMDFTLDEVKQLTLQAARAAFLPEAEREALVTKFESWFAADSESSTFPVA